MTFFLLLLRLIINQLLFRLMNSDSFKRPPTISHKGRPRTARITGPLEGRPQ
ncbi:hypothetical protein BDZ94DRAFT_1273382, partial [Collybia nuda]